MINIRQACKQIRTLIAQGHVEDAVKNLLALTQNSPLLNDAIMQSSRLQAVERMVLRRTIFDQEAEVSRNQIIEAVLSITAQIEETAAIDNDAAIQRELNVSFEEIARKLGMIWADLEEQREKLLAAKKAYTCLWVDDDPANDSLEFQILNALNIMCITARDPYKAYAFLRQSRPDIIVCNSLSRLKDNPNEGIEFCSYLTGKPEFRDIPVVFRSISLMKRLRNDEAVQLPENVRNNFQERDSLVIKDLVEEIIGNLA